MEESKTVMVSVSIERYEELIEAETKLATLCKMLRLEKPYNYRWYQAVAGDFLLPDLPKDGDAG